MVTFSGAALNLLVAAWMLPFIRILAMLSTAPLYDQKAIPMPARVGLAALLGLIMVPVLPPPPSLTDHAAVGVIAQQIVIGVSIGFSIKVVFTAFQIAGDVMGLQMGLAFAQFVDPSKGNQSPILGTLLTTLASLAFLSLNGHLMLIDAILKSFEIVPIGARSTGVHFENIFMAGGILFMLGLQIALPVISALLIGNIILGILAKASPQMNLMSIGFSITITMGVVVLSISTPQMVNTFSEALTRITTISILDQQPPATPGPQFSPLTVQ